MPTSIIYHNNDFPGEVREALQSGGEDWTVQAVEELDEISPLAEKADQPVVLYSARVDVHERARLSDLLARDGREYPFVCVVDDGDVESATRAIRDGASDYLFVEQLASPHALDTLRATLGRFTIQRHDDRLRRELEERSSELLGLNALANGVSNSLDRQTIVRRGLWVFAGICQQGAVALLELDPPPRLIEEGPEAPEDDDEEVTLKCSACFAADSVEFDGEFELNEGWRDVIFEDRTLTLEEADADGRFPGLDTFFHHHPNGSITLLPLRANRRPIGALVLGSVGVRNSRVKLTREGLRAMALQFGSALENARLFTEVKEAYESLQRAQDQLVHAEKFAAVGVLAAEIAHEINNPASFVISNLSVMLEYTEAIADFIDQLESEVEKQGEDSAEMYRELKEEFEIGFLREDMDSLLSRSLAGMQRIHQIVQDLRYLSRDAGEKPGWIELESLLDATVNLVSHEAKFRAELELDYGKDIPQVMSDASRLSQVFLNLLVNAVQSIQAGAVDRNRVRVATRRIGDEVEVSIEDTGEGIPEEVQERIFEPFFTTKETGEGTGLGLSISRDIVRSLGGRIEFDTEPGEGSRFRVIIPIRAEKFEEDENLRDSGYYDTPPGLDRISDNIFND